jgi:23S rRNA (uracil1939-C5)-methyltransferase
VTIAAVPGGVALAGVAAAAPGAPDRAAPEDVLRRRASVRGAVLRGPETRLVLGDPSVRLAVEDGLELELPVDAFAQVNPAANRLLVATVVGFAGPAAGERVLDLYCGGGNLSFPLARRGATVEGVERDPVAVDAARANAARLGIPGTTFHRASVAQALAGRAPGTVDAVVLDPPRAGAADAAAHLGALRAPRIVYVSCDPATLARDVGTLRACGYRVVRVQPIDAFPQTYHVESVAELRLT